jgi:hypothetical protein
MEIFMPRHSKIIKVRILKAKNGILAGYFGSELYVVLLMKI